MVLVISKASKEWVFFIKEPKKNRHFSFRFFDFLKENMEENRSYMYRTRFFEFPENQPVNGRVPKMISHGYLRSVDRGDACGRV
jgi:hypothetical protein